MGEVSAAMLSEKMRDVLNTAAEVCNECDNSCLMHIFGGLHRQRRGVRTAHIAEILAPMKPSPEAARHEHPSGRVRDGAYLPEGSSALLEDAQLRRNVRHATDVIRASAPTSSPKLADWQELRTPAAIKAHTMRHLDHYLQQFEQACTAAGGQVHWAADAEEANQIIAGLVEASTAATRSSRSKR